MARRRRYLRHDRRRRGWRQVGSRKDERPLAWWVPGVAALFAAGALQWVPAILGAGKGGTGIPAVMGRLIQPWMDALSIGVVLFGGIASAVLWLFAQRKRPRNELQLEKPNETRSLPKGQRLQERKELARAKAKEQAPKLAANEGVPKQPERPTAWSLELLRQLEWKRFEELCAAFFAAAGYEARTTRIGADGGVDVKLYNRKTARLEGVAQCKAWASYRVGVKVVRELLGVMTAQGVTKGYLLTTGEFTDEAKAFVKQLDGQQARLFLIDGELLLKLIQKLGPKRSEALLRKATEGDYSTPTCPSCGIKMRLRRAKANGEAFWGCKNYPRCRRTFKLRPWEAAKSAVVS